MLEIVKALKEELKETTPLEAAGFGVVLTAMITAVGATACILWCELWESKLIKIYKVKL